MTAQGRDLARRWRTEVLRSKGIHDSVRVLLLALHDDLDERGYSVVTRARTATRLGISERRVTDRYQKAIAAGLLASVSRGQKGRTAVYKIQLAGRSAREAPVRRGNWPDTSGTDVRTHG